MRTIIDRPDIPPGQRLLRIGPSGEEKNMAPEDLRTFLTAVQKSGDLINVDDEVDWDQELAGIGRLSCERNGPAFLFNNVKDYSPGWRGVANPVVGWRRFAVALGLPPDTPVRRLYQIYAEREQSLIPPVLVNDAPC